jgi:hypothetical protein
MQFIHPAKETIPTPVIRAIGPNPIIERYICPYCYSHKYTETKEPEPLQLSVLTHEEVPHADVNKYLAQGYVIVERYAKACIMQKHGPTPVEV